ncbi:ClpXP protease specificity-enhancing factor SspB [Candidatus Thioglobus sp.]|nr:ClpXP protease specificity-enhancing factor SspB [Candidatus Thioglobus sp.]
MSSVVPYLIRAYCDWIEDSGFTPHILVNSEKTGVLVPKGFASDGKVILNIVSSATEGRVITNKSISFKARFNGRLEKIIVPCNAVLSIYAKENGEGMFFDNKAEPLDQENQKPNLTILD